MDNFKSTEEYKNVKNSRFTAEQPVCNRQKGPNYSEIL